MYKLKTTENKKSVKFFLSNIGDRQKEKDCLEVLSIMKKITRKEPKMWGSSIIGFGNYHYKYDSGHEGDYFLTGFSPRKQNLTIYIMPGFSKYGSLMKKLGKYKTGKSCLYVKKLEDIDKEVLKKLIASSVEYMQKAYKTK